MDRWTDRLNLAAHIARAKALGRRAKVLAIKEMRTRPLRAGLCAAAALMLAVGVLSCQTAPTAPGTSAHLPTEPDIRVRIKSGIASVKLSGPGEFAVRRGTQSMTFPGPLTIAASPEGCRLTDGQNNFKAFAGTTPLEIAASDEGSAGAQRIKVDGMSYPGRIRILPRLFSVGGPNAKTAGTGPALASTGAPVIVLASDTPGDDSQPRTPSRAGPTPKLDVVELLPVETYLIGVVGAELYKDWPLGAFETQAVCARTYALHERERAARLGRDYDLESTTYDQAYNGGTQLPVAVKAVAETRGVVLTWEGHLLRAYYSSTCGGRTAAARDIWPTGPGYEFNLDGPIQSHHRESMCQSSPRYRWEVSRDRTELTKRIREWGKNNGSPVAKMGLLRGMRVDTSNADGRPVRYILEDEQRKIYPIECEALRSACNQATPGVPDVTKETKVSSSDLDMVIRGDKVSIRGRGFGHGVGMCQFCTKAMADRGDSWQQMVTRFYPGAKVERAY